jgi:hypothetical protein
MHFPLTLALGPQILKCRWSLWGLYVTQTPSLSISVQLCLASQDPMSNWWGDRRSFLPIYFLLLLTTFKNAWLFALGAVRGKLEIILFTRPRSKGKILLRPGGENAGQIPPPTLYSSGLIFNFSKNPDIWALTHSQCLIPYSDSNLLHS